MLYELYRTRQLMGKAGDARQESGERGSEGRDLKKKVKKFVYVKKKQ